MYNDIISVSVVGAPRGCAELHPLDMLETYDCGFRNHLFALTWFLGLAAPYLCIWVPLKW